MALSVTLKSTSPAITYALQASEVRLNITRAPMHSPLPGSDPLQMDLGQFKPMLVVVVADTLIEAGINAGDLAKQIGSIMGGGGGGRPSIATAGGKDQKSLETAMEKAKDIILKNIEEKNAV